jgi:hypothetical protein
MAVVLAALEQRGLLAGAGANRNDRRLSYRVLRVQLC